MWSGSHSHEENSTDLKERTQGPGLFHLLRLVSRLINIQCDCSQKARAMSIGWKGMQNITYQNITNHSRVFNLHRPWFEEWPPVAISLVWLADALERCPFVWCWQCCEALLFLLSGWSLGNDPQPDLQMPKDVPLAFSTKNKTTLKKQMRTLMKLPSIQWHLWMKTMTMTLLGGSPGSALKLTWIPNLNELDILKGKI